MPPTVVGTRGITERLESRSENEPEPVLQFELLRFGRGEYMVIVLKFLEPGTARSDPPKADRAAGIFMK